METLKLYFDDTYLFEIDSNLVEVVKTEKEQVVIVIFLNKKELKKN